MNKYEQHDKSVIMLLKICTSSLNLYSKYLYFLFLILTIRYKQYELLFKQNNDRQPQVHFLVIPVLHNAGHTV